MSATRKTVDYHVHSTHSSDGRSTIPEMCVKAVELGIGEIGFAEHVDFDPRDRGFGFFNYDGYSSGIESARESFGKRLVIWKGVEIDYQRSFEDEIEDWLLGKRFDFVIGSVHYLDHKFIDRQLVASSDLRTLYDAYFAEATRSVESGLFDVVGHLDIISKIIDKGLGHGDSAYEEGVRMVLGKIMKKKMYLEMNSKLSVLKGPCADTMPSREVVEEYIRNGGRLISLGSDAHSTEELGCGVVETLDFLSRYDRNQIELPFQMK